MACIHPNKSHKMHIFWFVYIGNQQKINREDETTKLTMATHSVVTSHYIAH